MKIDLLCNDGSPLGIVWKDIYEEGVGGAELAMLTLTEYLSKAGHQVTVFNNPRQACTANGVKFDNIANFNKEDMARDILIVFRSPNSLAIGAKAKRKIWWSTDQFTVGNFSEFISHVDFCVTISVFHTNYHKTIYSFPAEKIGHIDLGVRDDYGKPVGKIKNRMIFCSVPGRGLAELRPLWGAILKIIPDASLVITSDYRLWGAKDPNNHMFKIQWMGANNVSFLGKVKRRALVRYQQESEIMIYPCNYEELFCISVAECQVAGAYPVTSAHGALSTTNRFGSIISGIPGDSDFNVPFTEEVISLLTSRRHELESRQTKMSEIAPVMFSWEAIANTWLELFETGVLDV